MASGTALGLISQMLNSIVGWFGIVLSRYSVPGTEIETAETDPLTAPIGVETETLPAVCRTVSWLKLVPNFLEDQKRIWLFPKRLLQGEYWLPTLAFLVGVGVFFAMDPYDPGYFRQSNFFHAFNLLVSGQNATLFMTSVPLLFYVAGLLRRDDYMKQTSLFTLQAVLSAQVLTQVLKGIGRRVRPVDVFTYAHITDTWLRQEGPWWTGPGCFPSGHMIGATCVATIFAVRYRRHRWAPWLAYGLALTIGFSRVTLLSHFPSDVFAGAFLGYVTSNFVVLRQNVAQTSDEDLTR